MNRNVVRRGGDHESSKVVKMERSLHDALKVLFELLEEYGPVWYEKQHHDIAESALRRQRTLERIFATRGYKQSKRAA